MIKCRLCGVAGHEAKGVVLQRVNEKGVEGIWECRPACGAGLPLSETLPAAIDGRYDEPSPARMAAIEIDNLLSTRLSATAYLTETPSIQELTAIIESSQTLKAHNPPVYTLRQLRNDLLHEYVSDEPEPGLFHFFDWLRDREAKEHSPQ